MHDEKDRHRGDTIGELFAVLQLELGKEVVDRSNIVVVIIVIIPWVDGEVLCLIKCWLVSDFFLLFFCSCSPQNERGNQKRSEGEKKWKLFKGSNNFFQREREYGRKSGSNSKKEKKKMDVCCFLGPSLGSVLLNFCKKKRSFLDTFGEKKLSQLPLSFP